METARGRSNRNAVFRQAARASLSCWSQEDELSVCRSHHGHRYGPTNSDYDFPIDMWVERRIAAEKKQIEKAPSLDTKLSSHLKNTAQPAKTPQMRNHGDATVNPLLTFCSLVCHCEAISDFEEFKGHSLIAALTSRSANDEPTRQRTVKNNEGTKSGTSAKYKGSTYTVAGDEDKSPTDCTSTSMLQKKIPSTDPETTRKADHPGTRRFLNESSSASLGRNPSSQENDIGQSSSLKSDTNHSDSVSHSDSVIGDSDSFNEADSKLLTSECKFALKQQKRELPKPVRFYYTRLNAAVQSRLNQLNQLNQLTQHSVLGPERLRLPSITPFSATSQTPPTQYRFGRALPPPLLSSSGHVTSSAQRCFKTVARALTGYHASDPLSSGSFSKPVTKQSVLAALARVRFQTEGLDKVGAASTIPPPSEPPSIRRRPSDEQREASAALEALGQTCVIRNTSSIIAADARNTQLFHIGDLLQAMDSNRKRETSVSHCLTSFDDLLQ